MQFSVVWWHSANCFSMAPRVKSYQVEPPYFGVRELDFGEQDELLTVNNSWRMKTKHTMENNLGDIDRVEEKDCWNGGVNRFWVFRQRGRDSIVDDSRPRGAPDFYLRHGWLWLWLWSSLKRSFDIERLGSGCAPAVYSHHHNDSHDSQLDSPDTKIDDNDRTSTKFSIYVCCVWFYLWWQLKCECWSTQKSLLGNIWLSVQAGFKSRVRTRIGWPSSQ